MIVSFDWLKDFTQIDESREELAEILSSIGLEAEIKPFPDILPGVIIGLVEKTIKHPDADKLKVCTINDGVKTHQVICGAPNIKAGQKIPFATVGSVLPGNFKIKKANIRGIDSFGMVCSERELNITDEHEGIMVLPDGLKIGENFMTSYGYKFSSIEIDITPNRPDAFSHYGVARDLATYKNNPLKPLKIKNAKGKNLEEITISIENQEDCPRYIAGVVNNIKVGPSPAWMVERLKASGLRSINNVVDISNYVLLEIGHPTHIFDSKKIKNKEILVRRAKKNEKLQTLDGNKYELTIENLVIANSNDPIALAGVIGGMKSSVSLDTKSVLIESAYFDPITIRKSSKVLSLSTDASKRFERGSDPNICDKAFHRIVQLLQELAGGELVSRMIDIYPNPIKKQKITLRKSEIFYVLGLDIAMENVENILAGLEIDFEKNVDSWICKPPTFRPDITREIDLIEEVARIFGYNNIPIDNSINGNYNFLESDSENKYDFIRNYCAGLGFHQIYSNSLQNETDSHRSDLIPVKMLNPLNRDMAFLRTHLIIGLITSAIFNIKNGTNNFRLFELGNTHQQLKAGLEGVLESKHFAGIIFGKNSIDSIHGEGSFEDIYSLKGILSFIFEIKFDTKLEYKEESFNCFDGSYAIFINRQKVGYMGKISDSMTSDIKINKSSLYGFEINLEPIKGMLNRNNKFKEINLYPEINRDLNLVLSSNQDAGDIVKLISKVGKKLIKKITPSNLFNNSETLGLNLKSLTFSIVFQHPSKTLEDKDVNPIIDEIIRVAEKDFLAKLRV